LNELEYISWKEFKKMAPSIIKLEINRIGKLINTFAPESDIHNDLIKVRYELSQFIECLDQTVSLPLSDSCTGHLSKAILNLSPLNVKENNLEIIHNILDRLNYVYNRIEMIY
jgi:hypothetical protein